MVGKLNLGQYREELSEGDAEYRESVDEKVNPNEISVKRSGRISWQLFEK